MVRSERTKLGSQLGARPMFDEAASDQGQVFQKLVDVMRHTCATLLLEAGMHPRVVAERLGHSTPALVLNVYGHVTDRMQEQVTAVLDQVLA